MGTKKAWVEYSPYDEPIRIFRSKKAAQNSPLWGTERIRFADRKPTVYHVRFIVFYRQKGECIRCGKYLTFKTMHLDERKSRGKGGEISLENSEALCAACHIVGPTSKHGRERLPKFKS